MEHDESAAAPMDDASDLSHQELREALQNLRLHQIELEMQNDELRRIQAELNTSDARYFDFYDMAPVGYVTVNERALILQANLTTASLLGVLRAELIGKALPGFMSASDADRYYLFCKQVLASASEQPCELQMRQASGNLVWVKLQAIAVPGDAGAAVIRMVLSDITVRKQLEERLIRGKADSKAVLDGASDAIFITDSAGRYEYVNQQAIQLLGFSHDELLGMGFHDITPDDDLAATQVLFQQLLDKGVLRYEPVLKRRDGSTVSVELNCRVLADGRVFGACRDISERKQSEAQRRQLEQAAKQDSENQFRLVADNTSDGILIVGADRQVQYVSSAYLKQLGYSQIEELGRTPERFFSHTHPQERDAIVQRIKCAIESKTTELLYSSRARHRLGHYVWRENNIRFQYDEFGNFAGVCVIARDITQRRQNEEDLRIAAAAFESQEAMMITDANSVILRVNQAFTRVTGYLAEEAVGQNIRLLQSGRHDQDFYRQLWGTVRSQGSWQGEIWDRHKDGLVYPKWLTITAVNGIDGAVSHYIGSHFDLSERKRAEAGMLEMNRNLTKSRQQLRQLVALNETTLEKEKRHIAREVHDELGQVLTALRMDLTLATIRHASQVPDLNDALSGMQNRVDHAIQCVRNVANSLRPPVLDMGLETAIEWLSREFTKHGTAACALHGIGDRSFEIDDSRAVVVFRIVQEALTNVTKYASASQVDITLERCEDDLRLEIRDNGIGFDPVAVAQRGTLGWLGMRERVKALDGRIEVSSAPGQGTTITLVIPLKPEAAKDSA